MNMRNLDKGSQTPLYLQLTERLIKQIETGQLSTGDKLPSERELADSLNVSRITARMAIDNLLEKGLVYREQGKGTYVAQPKMRGVRGFSSFSEDAKARGLNPSSRIIHQELILLDEKMQQILKVGKEEYAVHLVRVRMVDDKPIALQSTFIPHKICPGIESLDLTDKSLFAVLREEYFIHPAWTEAIVRAKLADSEEAEMLDINTGDPVLVVSGLTFTEAFDIVESVTTVYPAENFELYIGRQRIERHS
jgi:GntR family transcriptional regulator